MLKNIIKILSLCLITILSIQISSYCINDYVIDVRNKQKTIADLIVEQQSKKLLEEAEKKIEEAKEKDNITIETENIEMKPPVEKKNTKNDTEENQDTNTNTNDQLGTTDSIGTDTNDKNEKNVEQVIQDCEEIDDSEYAIVIEGLGKYKKLDDKAKNEIVQYLIDNYFLDGYVYCQNETNEERLARKQLACSMEYYMLSSANELYKVIGMLQQLNLDGAGDILDNIKEQKDEFIEAFSDVSQNGKEFDEIYINIVQYFDKCTDTLEILKKTADELNNSPNKFLSLTMILTSINNDIIPKFIDIIDSACDLQEKINAIYLEGIEGKKLLSKDEVLGIVNKLQDAVLSGN